MDFIILFPRWVSKLVDVSATGFFIDGDVKLSYAFLLIEIRKNLRSSSLCINKWMDMETFVQQTRKLEWIIWMLNANFTPTKYANESRLCFHFLQLRDEYTTKEWVRAIHSVCTVNWPINVYLHNSLLPTIIQKNSDNLNRAENCNIRKYAIEMYANVFLSYNLKN